MEPRAFRNNIPPITRNLAERIKKWAKPEFDPQLANLCEQVREAVHYAMGPVLQQHKVAEDNFNHGQRQLTALVKCDSWNVFNMSATKKKKKSMKK